MARGRKTSLMIRLTPVQRRTLLTWQRATVPAGLARRARIILLLADGVTITDIAATVGMSRRHTYTLGSVISVNPLHSMNCNGLDADFAKPLFNDFNRLDEK